MLISPSQWLTADPRPYIVHSSLAALSVGRAASKTKCPSRVQKPSIALSSVGPRKVSRSMGYYASFASSMSSRFTYFATTSQPLLWLRIPARKAG